jgi:hypothetical protein
VNIRTLYAGLTRIDEERVYEADDRGLRAVVRGRGLEHVIRVGHQRSRSVGGLLYPRLDERRPLGIKAELVDEGLDVGTGALVGPLCLETNGGECCSEFLDSLAVCFVTSRAFWALPKACVEAFAANGSNCSQNVTQTEFGAPQKKSKCGRSGGKELRQG